MTSHFYRLPTFRFGFTTALLGHKAITSFPGWLPSSNTTSRIFGVAVRPIVSLGVAHGFVKYTIAFRKA